MIAERTEPALSDLKIAPSSTLTVPVAGTPTASVPRPGPTTFADLVVARKMWSSPVAVTAIERTFDAG